MESYIPRQFLNVNSRIPPAPSVEDEVSALAREIAGSGGSSPEEDVKWPGDVNQLPILLAVGQDGEILPEGQVSIDEAKKQTVQNQQENTERGFIWLKPQLDGDDAHYHNDIHYYPVPDNERWLDDRAPPRVETYPSNSSRPLSAVDVDNRRVLHRSRLATQPDIRLSASGFEAASGPRRQNREPREVPAVTAASGGAIGLQQSDRDSGGDSNGNIRNQSVSQPPSGSARRRESGFQAAAGQDYERERGGRDRRRNRDRERRGSELDTDRRNRTAIETPPYHSTRRQLSPPPPPASLGDMAGGEGRERDRRTGRRTGTATGTATGIAIAVGIAIVIGTRRERRPRRRPEIADMERAHGDRREWQEEADE